MAWLLLPASAFANLLPGNSVGCWGGDFTYERCCLQDDGSCWEGLSKDMCCSGFVELALQSQEGGGGAYWQYSSLADEVDARETQPDLRLCMERRYTSPWNEETNYLCHNNFVQAAACLARLPGVKVILDVFLGGACTASAMAYASLDAGRRGAEILSFELPEKLSESTGAGSRLAEGEGTWWEILQVNHTESLDELQHILVEPRPAVLPRLLLMPSLPAVDSSWNSLDVLCQHRRPVDLVLVDTSPLVMIEKEWMIIEAVCKPRRALLANLNLPSASAWIWQRLVRLGWRQTLAGHYVLGDSPWPHHSELRRVRAWALLEAPS
ncbi:unnamed protein product [Effrenium voratum]|uniref:Uncharacterized protein n=1 Tax=Effrenium voratum TaxID=2562239 RepID=A0AA36MZX2_9DINO|nr:unnamed protein product [Effrenium voratum]